MSNGVVKDFRVISNKDKFFNVTSSKDFMDKYLDCLNEVNILLDKLKNEDISYKDKLSLILNIQTLAVKALFNSVSEKGIDENFVNVLTKVINSLKDIITTINKEHEVESSDNVDIYSPKIQILFTWLLELFSNVLEENGVEEIKRSNIFNSLSTLLVGWEDKVSKRLKGISSVALDQIENPFKLNKK